MSLGEGRLTWAPYSTVQGTQTSGALPGQFVNIAIIVITTTTIAILDEAIVKIGISGSIWDYHSLAIAVSVNIITKVFPSP